MTVLGIHGLKQRWVADTLRSGLVRQSAAWFVTSGSSWSAHATATMSAAVYLALSPRIRQLLTTEAGDHTGYQRTFRRQPELLPALVIFADQPAPTDVFHRYLWLGAGPAPTEPYTKVERSRRVVRPAAGDFHVVDLTVAEVAAIEDRIAGDGRPESWWREHPLLLRGAPDMVWPADPTQVRHTRIGAFCAEVARHLVDRVERIPHIAHRIQEKTC